MAKATARTMTAMAALLACGAFAGPGSAQDAPPTAAITAAVLAEPAAVSQGELSPSGRYLAFVVRRGEASVLRIQDLEAGTATSVIGSRANENFGGNYIDWIRWKSDDRLIVGLTNVQVLRTGNRTDGDVYSSHYGRSILSIARDGVSHVGLVSPYSEPGNPGYILDILADDPDHVLMKYRNHTRGLDVARVDVTTGAAERILEGDSRVRDYIVDRAGTIVGRISVRGAMEQIVVMETREGDRRWREAFRIRQDDVRELADYTFLGAAEDANQVYVGVASDAEGGDLTAGVHIYDFATRTLGPTLWRNPAFDAVGVVIDEKTSELLGGCYVDDVFRCEVTAPGRADDMEAIRRLLGPDYSVRLASQAREGSKWLIFASAPTDPGQYYLYDVTRHQLTHFTGVYRTPTDTLAPMTRVDYAGADGQALRGYLTRPSGAAPDARLPLVVLPHGGPELRDSLGYDIWAQFLASRGYQVFQPNFRGSSGFGQAFADAGRRQWGGMMQADIEAGVDHLVAQGLADPARMCIVGASYGGYAALEAGASLPGRYRCVMSISGPGDLGAMLRWERSENGGDSDTYEYWVKSIGDPGADREAIDAVSPELHADRFTAPVLLVHGDIDDIVPVEQSRDMERALKRAGKDVRLVELTNQGHTGWTTETEVRVMNEMADFLAAHLPVD